MLKMLRVFWNCGDTSIVDFAILRARLNRKEKEVLRLMLDECMTQEEAAEELDCSPRHIQNLWYSAANKLISIPWVIAYVEYLVKKEEV